MKKSIINYAASISEHHQQAQLSAKTAIDHAFEAGKLLIEAKEITRHGEWLSFLKDTGVNTRTAQRYMRLARNKHKSKSDTVSSLNMAEALEHISDEEIKPHEEEYLFSDDGMFKRWIWADNDEWYHYLELFDNGEQDSSIDFYRRPMSWAGIKIIAKGLNKMELIKDNTSFLATLRNSVLDSSQVLHS